MVAAGEDPFSGDPRISLSLLLPRDAQSVPVVRHLCEHMIASLGASEDAIGSISVALTEACSNVIRHARSGDDYRIDVELGGERCEISVCYRDEGFDPDGPAIAQADPESESGRGLMLMRALVDELNFTFDPGRTRVHMVKDLDFARTTDAQRLLQRRT